MRGTRAAPTPARALTRSSRTSARCWHERAGDAAGDARAGGGHRRAGPGLEPVSRGAGVLRRRPARARGGAGGGAGEAPRLRRPLRRVLRHRVSALPVRDRAGHRDRAGGAMSENNTERGARPDRRGTLDSADDLFAPDMVREILYRYRTVKRASFDQQHDRIEIRLDDFLTAIDEARRDGYSDAWEAASAWKTDRTGRSSAQSGAWRER